MLLLFVTVISGSGLVGFSINSTGHKSHDPAFWYVEAHTVDLLLSLRS